ncbi:unnamed protein product [Lactuca saligna]|uniref:Transposase (putative) gypsy type domain-containing protein n=1 Tax=Lactuca saligna TaxID=75948 RepID=A0AA36EPT0_LACSI|nr:unnamed protein product [Lactuca saligna]
MDSNGISHISTVRSKLSVRSMSSIVRKYDIDAKFHPRPHEPGDAITNTPKYFVGVYLVFFKSGLWLHAFDFSETILDYYGLHIAQITPDRFRRMLCFMLLCIALDIVPSITIFRHFYLHMSKGDWVSFSLCHDIVELCDSLLTFVKYRK